MIISLILVFTTTPPALGKQATHYDSSCTDNSLRDVAQIFATLTPKRVTQLSQETHLSLEQTLALAMAYHQGRHTKRNRGRARGYLTQGLSSGQPVARYLYANAEQRGRALPPETLIPMADKGFLDAQVALAHHYMQEAKHNDAFFERVYHWYEKAARQGCSEAMWHIAGLLASGQGVEKNRYDAIVWYQLSAYEKPRDIELGALIKGFTQQDLILLTAAAKRIKKRITFNLSPSDWAKVTNLAPYENIMQNAHDAKAN
jgi:TPR repeat protein